MRHRAALRGISGASGVVVFAASGQLVFAHRSPRATSQHCSKDGAVQIVRNTEETSAWRSIAVHSDRGDGRDAGAASVVLQFLGFPFNSFLQLRIMRIALDG
jgi:hypothetical protein